MGVVWWLNFRLSSLIFDDDRLRYLLLPDELTFAIGLAWFAFNLHGGICGGLTNAVMVQLQAIYDFMVVILDL